LFFSIREHLQASDWIMFQTVGSKVYERLEAGDVEIIAKLWGYHCGPLALNMLIAWFDSQNGGPAHSLDPHLAWLCELAVAVTTVSATDDPLGLLRLFDTMEQFDLDHAQQMVIPVMKPVAIEQVEVRIDPEVVQGERADGAPEVPETSQIEAEDPVAMPESNSELTEPTTLLATG
jgi:hypothetical protein